jgi:hypothetical protein
VFWTGRGCIPTPPLLPPTPPSPAPTPSRPPRLLPQVRQHDRRARADADALHAICRDHRRRACAVLVLGSRWRQLPLLSWGGRRPADGPPLELLGGFQRRGRRDAHTAREQRGGRAVRRGARRGARVVRQEQGKGRRRPGGRWREGSGRRWQDDGEEGL